MKWKRQAAKRKTNEGGLLTIESKDVLWRAERKKKPSEFGGVA